MWSFFFFNDTATTEIYPLSLHDALPICPPASNPAQSGGSMTAASTAEAVSFHPYKTTDTASGAYQGYVYGGGVLERGPPGPGDRESTRLKSPHAQISYAAFCLQKKKINL